MRGTGKNMDINEGKPNYSSNEHLAAHLPSLICSSESGFFTLSRLKSTLSPPLIAPPPIRYPEATQQWYRAKHRRHNGDDLHNVVVRQDEAFAHGVGVGEEEEVVHHARAGLKLVPTAASARGTVACAETWSETTAAGAPDDLFTK